MRLHPYCELFPAMEGEELQALADDIKANGQREMIYTLDNLILDGRNRFAACKLAKVQPRTIPYDGKDPLGFVLSKNLHRRHLTESQRAMVAAKLAGLSHGGDRRSDQAANLPLETQASAAEKLNVSERTVRDAAKVLKEAPPEEVKKVESGEKPVSRAAKEVREKAAPRPAPTKKKDTLQDANGTDVPDSLRDLFADPFLADASERLVKLEKELKSVERLTSGKGTAWAFLLVSEVIGHLKTAANEVELARSQFTAARPHIVCPACGGTGCKSKDKKPTPCRQSGWLPKWRVEELKREGTL